MDVSARGAGPFCADRIGVARLTKMAFDGVDLHPLRQDLSGKWRKDRATAGIGMDLSVLAQLMGDQAIGLAIQAEVLRTQRLFRTPCKTPRRRLLALAGEADIGDTTPIEFLLEDSDVELMTLYVVPGLEHEIPPHDAAIVVASDCTPGTLDEIERLMAGRPLLNAPEGIRNLDRDRLFHILAWVPGLVIPQTARLARADLVSLGPKPSVHLASFESDASYPFIVRPVGSHAGRGLAKLDSNADIDSYLASQNAEEFFLSPYMDYASPDGLFRKYRVVCIGGKPYACHMAISHQWKIWYLNADMTESVAKRTEEAHFFETFDAAFAVRHAKALRQMAARVGLDYFQVDCAETADGKLLVFEADNTAIVHNMDPPDVFAYKPPQMRKVFEAFVQMIHEKAALQATNPYSFSTR